MLRSWQEITGSRFDLGLKTKLERSHLLEAKNAIELWQNNTPPEATGVQKIFGVPSLVVSMDCAPNHSLNIMDIEGGAGGLGLAQLINDPLARRLEEHKKNWPELRFIASRKMLAKHDYDLWLEDAEGHDLENGDLLFVVAGPGEMLNYRNVSASLLLTRGDKTYGENWLWSNAGLDDFERLFNHWPEGFCLKSQNSRQMKGLYIFHPRRGFLDRRGIHGASTRHQIFRALEDNETMYCQPFQSGVFAFGEIPTIHRLFFFYDVKMREYVYAGGLLISRPSLKTCSVYNATFGFVN
ncbi:MAG: hypothetical protein WC456_05005 [Patescibacteria group bacterium]